MTKTAGGATKTARYPASQSTALQTDPIAPSDRPELSKTPPVVAAQFPVWSASMRAYLRQQITQSANSEERADAIRLAQRLANA